MKIYLIILGMAAVTFIPRALPAVLIGRLNFGWRVERFLELIPYTAMTALIVPGILSVDKTHAYIGIAGGLAAVLISLKNTRLALVILGAVAAVMLLYFLT